MLKWKNSFTLRLSSISSSWWFYCISHFMITIILSRSHLFARCRSKIKCYVLLFCCSVSARCDRCSVCSIISMEPKSDGRWSSKLWNILSTSAGQQKWILIRIQIKRSRNELFIVMWMFQSIIGIRNVFTRLEHVIGLRINAQTHLIVSKRRRIISALHLIVGHKFHFLALKRINC